MTGPLSGDGRSRVHTGHSEQAPWPWYGDRCTAGRAVTGRGSTPDLWCLSRAPRGADVERRPSRRTRRRIVGDDRCERVRGCTPATLSRAATARASPLGPFGSGGAGRMAGWRGQSRVRADEEARAGDASTPESTIVGPRPEPPQRDEPPAGLPCGGSRRDDGPHGRTVTMWLPSGTSRRTAA